MKTLAKRLKRHQATRLIWSRLQPSSISRTSIMKRLPRFLRLRTLSQTAVRFGTTSASSMRNANKPVRLLSPIIVYWRSILITRKRNLRWLSSIVKTNEVATHRTYKCFIQYSTFRTRFKSLGNSSRSIRIPSRLTHHRSATTQTCIRLTKICSRTSSNRFNQAMLTTRRNSSRCSPNNRTRPN